MAIHSSLFGSVTVSGKEAKAFRRAMKNPAASPAAKVVELLPQLTDVDAQRSAIDALAIAGNGEALAQLVRGSSSAALRLHAIRALSIVPAERSVPLLIALYREQRDPALRRALLHALGSSGDDAALKAIGETLE